MARLGFLLVAVFVAILVISTQQVSALQCWACNNNQLGCAEQLDSGKLNGQQFNCPNGRCLKRVDKSTDAGKETIIINRSCQHSQQEADIECKRGTPVFCESCNNEDGCNGSAQYGPVAALVIAIPIAITKIFLF